MQDTKRSTRKREPVPPATGWQDGLCQDYDRKLHKWFASRLDARIVVRRFYGEQRVIAVVYQEKH